MYICGVKQDENSSVVVTPNREELSWEELSRRDAKEPLASKMAFVSLPGGFHFCAFWWHLDFHHSSSGAGEEYNKSRHWRKRRVGGGRWHWPWAANTTIPNEGPLQSSQPLVLLQSYWLHHHLPPKSYVLAAYKSRLSMLRLLLVFGIYIPEAMAEIQIMSASLQL